MPNHHRYHQTHPAHHPQPRRRATDLPPLALDVPRSENPHPTLGARFATLATHAANAVGSPIAFLAAILVIAAWAVTGPMFHFSDTWQLVINTGTTIITFLMVFLIQNTQNRDAKAIHLKLNEIVHALRGAHNELIEVEKLSDEELKKLDEHYQRIREEFERRDRQKQRKKTA